MCPSMLSFNIQSVVVVAAAAAVTKVFCCCILLLGILYGVFSFGLHVFPTVTGVLSIGSSLCLGNILLYTASAVCNMCYAFLKFPHGLLYNGWWRSMDRPCAVCMCCVLCT